MLKYKIQRGFWIRAEIEAVEVLRETESFVFLPSYSHRQKERREAKTNEFHEYYDSWTTAYAALTKKAEDRAREAHQTFIQAQQLLVEVRILRSPFKEVIEPSLSGPPD